MVCSALFIMDLKGKILISRNYRGDIPMSVSEKFTKHLYDQQHSTQEAEAERQRRLSVSQPLLTCSRSLLYSA